MRSRERDADSAKGLTHSHSGDGPVTSGWAPPLVECCWWTWRVRWLVLASLVVVNKRNARELYGYVRSGQRHTDDWQGSRGLGVSTRRIHKSFPSLGEWVSSRSVFPSLVGFCASQWVGREREKL